MTTAANYTVIVISVDGVWAGSGKLTDGIIADCGAQFCPDSDESENVYEIIEEAIAEGKNIVSVAMSDDTTKTIKWSIFEPS